MTERGPWTKDDGRVRQHRESEAAYSAMLQDVLTPAQRQMLDEMNRQPEPQPEEPAMSTQEQPPKETPEEKKPRWKPTEERLKEWKRDGRVLKKRLQEKGLTGSAFAKLINVGNGGVYAAMAGTQNPASYLRRLDNYLAEQSGKPATPPVPVDEAAPAPPMPEAKQPECHVVSSPPEPPDHVQAVDILTAQERQFIVAAAQLPDRLWNLALQIREVNGQIAALETRKAELLREVTS